MYRSIKIQKQIAAISFLFLVVAFMAACSTSDIFPIKRHPAMVVTANPLASKAGANILEEGGHAIDAVVAIQSVLTLVEPQSSGLGGGGYLVYFDASKKRIDVYDGREIAPLSAQPDMFLDSTGQQMSFLAAKTSGISIGVPGMVSLLEKAHNDHGNLAWAKLFNEAISLSENGFKVSPRLHQTIARFSKAIPSQISQGPVDAYQYLFTDKGKPLPIGHQLKNKAYADTLRTIAQNPRAFYEGELAQKIIEQVQRAPRPGGMTLKDLGAYQAEKKEPICTPYRHYKLCGPPPSSSWIAVAMIMRLLEYGPDFDQKGASAFANWSIFAQAQRLAYADRDRYVADDRFVEVPLQSLLNSDYIKMRANMISIDQPLEEIKHGEPFKQVRGADATQDTPGTTHFVVVDHQGNVAAMTASVEGFFGSTRMVGGLFLNNQLTDFSFQAVDDNGHAIANSVQPLKSPRSSMSPTIVLSHDNKFVMATGSPGGNSIIAYTAKTLIGILEWNLSPLQAVALPNMVARGDLVRIEKDRADKELVNALRNYGFNVQESAGENSGLSVVHKDKEGVLRGAADPRREGLVISLD